MGYERNEVLGRSSADFLTKPSRDCALSTAVPRLLNTSADHRDWVPDPYIFTSIRLSTERSRGALADSDRGRA